MLPRRTVIMGALAASASFRPTRKRRTRLSAGQKVMRCRGRSFSCSAAISW